jgi:hypothetical protein
MAAHGPGEEGTRRPMRKRATRGSPHAAIHALGRETRRLMGRAAQTRRAWKAGTTRSWKKTSNVASRKWKT